VCFVCISAHMSRCLCPCTQMHTVTPLELYFGSVFMAVFTYTSVGLSVSVFLFDCPYTICIICASASVNRRATKGAHTKPTERHGSLI